MAEAPKKTHPVYKKGSIQINCRTSPVASDGHKSIPIEAMHKMHGCPLNKSSTQDNMADVYIFSNAATCRIAIDGISV